MRAARAPRARRGRRARARRSRASGCGASSSASASTAPGSGSTPAIACGWIALPRSVRVAGRPGMIVSKKACSVAVGEADRGLPASAGSASAPRPAERESDHRAERRARRRGRGTRGARAPPRARCGSRRPSSASKYSSIARGEPSGAYAATAPVSSRAVSGRRSSRSSALVAALALLAPSAAAAAQPPSAGRSRPWDGSNPFNCEIQDVGTGTDFPDPGADPFCVEFDKTQQNVTDLGIVDFLAKEPARRRRGRRQVLLLPARPLDRLDRARARRPSSGTGTAATSLTRRRASSAATSRTSASSASPAAPGDYFPIPPDYTEYFDQGGVGAYLVLNIPVDPRCAEKIDTPEERAPIYGPGESSPLANPGGGAVAGAGAGGAAHPRRKAKRCKHRRSPAARKRCRAKHR